MYCDLVFGQYQIIFEKSDTRFVIRMKFMKVLRFIFRSVALVRKLYINFAVF